MKMKSFIFHIVLCVCHLSCFLLCPVDFSLVLLVFSDVVYFITGCAWLVLPAQRRCWRQETPSSYGSPGEATENT